MCVCARGEKRKSPKTISRSKNYEEEVCEKRTLEVKMFSEGGRDLQLKCEYKENGAWLFGNIVAKLDVFSGVYSIASVHHGSF